MRKNRTHRLLALALALTLALAPAASALTVEEARDLLRENYIDPIPEEILNLPTIGEITAAIGDPYTFYMPAQDYSDFNAELNDAEVVGIGAMVELTADGLRIISMPPDSPAKKAGLQPNDIIVGVDGTTMAQAGSAQVLYDLVPGEEGSRVVLTILRDKKTFAVTITRAKVIFPIVTGELMDDHIGWLTCTSFGEKTGTYFREYINKENAAADRWVIDLRGNPGGYGMAAIEAATTMVGMSDIAYAMFQDGSADTWRGNPMLFEVDEILDEPTILLTDGQSASASELLAACLRDYGVALVIGTRTYGKGVGQDVFEMEDGSAMKITSFRYYSPKYITPDRSGVLPNLVVDPNLADEVARLLSGKVAEKPSANVLTIRLAGQDWYVHKTAALAKEYQAAFAELLAALPLDAPMTLGGKAVTTDEVAKAWGVDVASRTFPDVKGLDTADEINQLAILGLLNGDENGNFNPQGQLTRAELATMVAQAMNYWCWENEPAAPFTDIPDDAWYKTPVDLLYSLDILSGDGGGRFNPDELITVQEFLTILGRMGAQADLSVRQHMDEAMEDEGITAPNVAKFAPWAQPAALTAEKLDYLSAPLAELDPTAVVTREQAASMVYHLLHYMGLFYVDGDFTPAQ